MLSVIGLFVFFILYSITNGQNTAVRETLSSASSIHDNFLPLGLLLTCVLTVLTTSGPALYFNQAEINVLFTAPTSRAALVVYKIMSYASSAFLSALLITLFLPKIADSRLATLVAIFLTLLFVQLLSTAVRMLLHVLSKRLPSIPFAKLVIALSICTFLLAWLFIASSKTNPIEALISAIESDISSITLYPLSVVTNLHFSTKLFPEFITLTMITVLMIVGLILSIIKMDEKLKEQSLMHSLQSQAKWQKIKNSGMLWHTDITEATSRQMPAHILRAYPMLWVQWLKLYRNYANAILFLAGIALVLGPFLALTNTIMSAPSRIAVLFFFCVFFMPRILVFDFRGTLEYMELLKKLPVKEWRICISQLILPVMLSSLLQTLLVLSAIPFLDSLQYRYILLLIALIIPINLILYLVENIIFLSFPARLVPVGRVDFDFLGRTLAEFLVKTLVLGLAAVITFAIVMGSFQYITHSWILLAAISWLTPVILGIALHLFLIRSFVRFDTSKYNLN